MARPARRSTSLLALLSFLLPGMGQLLQGRPLEGLLHFGLALALWVLLIGWLVHFWSTVDVIRHRPRSGYLYG